MANKLIWGSDLYKGFKLDQNKMLGTAINDILPFQMLTIKEKTLDWIKAVADYYEVCGWSNVEKKAGKIQRNYDMRTGVITPNDYIVDPNVNPFSDAVGMILPQEFRESPLQQFYSLAPSIIDLLRGEFTKKDNTWTIEAIDQFSIDEVFNNKKDKFEKAITDIALSQKMQSMMEMGMAPDQDPEAFNMEMQKFTQNLKQIELETRTFKTTGVKWAEKVLNVHEKKYKLKELEPDAFECSLITDSEFWHLDLLEDDFKLELLNPKWCDYHKAPNAKYVSDGDYFLWFDFMSAGDIVNKLGRRMKEEDILKLKDIYITTANMIVPDSEKNRQGAYYDLSKPWSQATDLDPKMNDALLGKELAYSYMRTPNFDHNMDVDILNPMFGRLNTGHPQMFRIMRLYWRSMRKIGLLTKISESGEVSPPEWIDENYVVTVDPIYDNSVIKTKTKDNLIYGEHVDWTWTPEWRHVIKISPNQKHTFWLNANNFNSIYIDGGPTTFQFKGRTNPFDSLPPVEGCFFNWINSRPHSLIDRLRPFQILYNIAMNRVPRKILDDKGLKVAVDRRIMSTNNQGTVAEDPIEAYEQKLENSTILDYTLSRDTLEGMGQPALPQVLQLTTVSDAQLYFRLAQEIKMEAGEVVGVTRQRLGKNMASDTAYGINQGINYSEVQTEKYYEQHLNLMERVRQRMLDAAQYYTTFKESSRTAYMNNMDETVMLEIEGTDNLLTHYNIHLQSRANVKEDLKIMSDFLINENTLPINPSAKLESLISKSVPKILNLIKVSELEQDRKEREQQEAEQQLQQQQLEYQRQITEMELANENEQKQLDRESAEKIAEMRALGGVQTDANANNELDSTENYLKMQELEDKNTMLKEQGDQKAQLEREKIAAQREKTLSDLKAKKYVVDTQLKIAKENKGS